MFLKLKASGDLVRVDNTEALFDPFIATLAVRRQAGEEEGDPVMQAKADMIFPSDEALPRCWVDAHYRISSN